MGIPKILISAGAFFSLLVFSGCSQFDGENSGGGVTSQLFKAENFYDTGANNSMEQDDSLFYFKTEEGETVVATDSTATNIHSHYVGGALFDNLIYSGKMKMTSSNSGIGVTFLSQYPNKDAYYRLRRYGNRPDFHFASHGGNQACELVSTGIKPERNLWYNFKVVTQVSSDQTVIMAKVWPDQSAEPTNFQAKCVDQSAERFQTGTIGLWSYNAGSKYWSNLRVSFDPFGPILVGDDDTPSTDPIDNPTEPEPMPVPPVQDPVVVTPVAGGFQWAKGRNGDGHLLVDTKTSQFGTLAFDYERSDEVFPAPPVGHGIPKGVKNRLFYNLLIDGYMGLPPGNCLRQVKYMSASDPTRSLCAETENADLLRNWAQSDGTGFQNVLFKNLTVKNAIRTINAAPSSELPHTDVFQAYYPGSASEMATAQWLVIQDSIFKNSDNSIMIAAKVPQRGVVYQNLDAGFCDSWFIDDRIARVKNDFAAEGKTPPAKIHACTNSMMAALQTKGDIWIINSRSSGAVYANPRGGRVILIGSSRDMKLRTDSGIDIGLVCKYETIEEAMSDKNASDGCGNFTKPPFIELSCSGWAQKPANCVDHKGAF